MANLRKKIFSFMRVSVLILCIVVLFQNCGTNPQMGQEVASLNSVLSSSTTNGNSPTTTTQGTGTTQATTTTSTTTSTTTTTTTTTTLPGINTAVVCPPFVGTSEITSTLPASFEVNSGLAMANNAPYSRSNRSASVPVISANPINNQTQYTANGCSHNVTLDCQVVVDAARPATITNMLNSAGVNVAANFTSNTSKKDEIENAVAINGCGIMPGNLTLNVQLAPTHGTYKCVEASFFIAIRTDVRVPLLNSTVKSSTVRYVPVNLNNNCLPEHKLSTTGVFDLGAGDLFGNAVAIKGSTAVSIANQDDGDNNTVSNVGAAYVFNKNGASWEVVQRITTPDGTAFDDLKSVSLSNTWLALGAAGKNSYSGRVYLYEKVGSSFVYRSAISGSNNEKLGTDLAITENELFIGAPEYGATKSGAVYVYNLSGGSWVSSQTLVPSGAATDQIGFGRSLAYDSDLLVIGAPMALLYVDTGTGSAYYSQRAGATFGTPVKLTTPSGMTTMGAQVGYDVATYGGKIVVGAPMANTSRRGASAYYATPTSSAVLVNNQTNVDQGQFGFSLAMNANGVFFAARHLDAGAGGQVDYIQYSNLTATTLQQTVKTNFVNRMFSTNRSSTDQFGFSISVDGTNLMVGAPNKSVLAGQDGATYIYEVP